MPLKKAGREGSGGEKGWPRRLGREKLLARLLLVKHERDAATPKRDASVSATIATQRVQVRDTHRVFQPSYLERKRKRRERRVI